MPSKLSSTEYFILIHVYKRFFIDTIKTIFVAYDIPYLQFCMSVIDQCVLLIKQQLYMK